MDQSPPLQESAGTPLPLDPTQQDLWVGWALWALILAWGLAGAWIIHRRRLWKLDGPAPSPTDAALAPALLASGIGIWLAQMMTTVPAYGVLDVDPDQPHTLSELAILIGVGLGGGAIATGAILAILHDLRRALLPGPPTPRVLLQSVGAFAIVLPWVFLVGALGTLIESLRASAAGEEGPGAIAHDTLAQLAQEGAMFTAPWWAIVLMVILGTAALEEIIFRGCLQGALERSLMRREASRSSVRWIAITISSLIFAGAHAANTPWYGLVTLFALSLGFGAAYARTRMILVPITMHALFNTVNIVMATWGG